MYCTVIVVSMAVLTYFFAPTVVSATEPAQMRLVSTPNPLGSKFWIDFCSTAPDECLAGTVVDIALTQTLITELEAVNTVVNMRGNRTRNNCVWITLEKRRVLVANGFPQSALLPTIVDSSGGSHMVLTVKTDQGDFVMDNYIYPHKVQLWSRLVKYRFESRYAGTSERWWDIHDNRSALALQ